MMFRMTSKKSIQNDSILEAARTTENRKFFLEFVIRRKEASQEGLFRETWGNADQGAMPLREK
ncbi:MAG: hypothetical protein NPIRA01_04490 [Nitrospirales bacterium]|nr:MAG: hypothetical protein NPIRA01_04490 [Nitrospirales bacterium]